MFGKQVLSQCIMQSIWHSHMTSLSVNCREMDLTDWPLGELKSDWMVTLKELCQRFNVQVEASDECCSSEVGIGISIV